VSIKNQAITLILAKISQGMKAQEAINSVLGQGIADKLKQLRRNNMKKILLALALIPSIAAAECDSDCQLFAELYNLPVPTSSAPAYGLPVQPALPVPQDKGPWGTGYSIVTSTRPQRNLYDRDVTGSETVQRIVPNDALGQPMRGLDLTTGW
jgi:hypothetical protein